MLSTVVMHDEELPVRDHEPPALLQPGSMHVAQAHPLGPHDDLAAQLRNRIRLARAACLRDEVLVVGRTSPIPEVAEPHRCDGRVDNLPKRGAHRGRCTRHKKLVHVEASDPLGQARVAVDA